MNIENLEMLKEEVANASEIEEIKAVVEQFDSINGTDLYWCVEGVLKDYVKPSECDYRFGDRSIQDIAYVFACLDNVEDIYRIMNNDCWIIRNDEIERIYEEEEVVEIIIETLIEEIDTVIENYEEEEEQEYV